jgi:hypothetical protein
VAWAFGERDEDVAKRSDFPNSSSLHPDLLDLVLPGCDP